MQFPIVVFSGVAIDPILREAFYDDGSPVVSVW